MNLTAEQASLLEESLHELELPLRVINALERSLEVFTIGDLLQTTRSQLEGIPNFGPQTVENIYAKFEQRGFYRTGRRPVDNNLSSSATSLRRQRVRNALGS